MGKEVEAIEEVSASAENTVEAVPVVTEKQQLSPEGAAAVVGTAKSSVPVPKRKLNGQLERAKTPTTINMQHAVYGPKFCMRLSQKK